MTPLAADDDEKVKRQTAFSLPGRRTALIVTRRRVRQEYTRDFEEALRAIVTFSTSLPGHVDMHVLTRVLGGDSEWTIASRFFDGAARQAFTSSVEYRTWLVRLRTLTNDLPEDAGSEEGGEDQVECDKPKRASVRAWAFLGGLVFFFLYVLVWSLPPLLYFAYFH